MSGVVVTLVALLGVLALVVVALVVALLGPVVMGVVVVVPTGGGLGGTGQVGDGHRVDHGGLCVQRAQHRRDERVVAAAVHDDHVRPRQSQLVAGARLVLVGVLRRVVDDRFDLNLGVRRDRLDERGVHVRRGHDRRPVAVTRGLRLPTAARQDQGGQREGGDEDLRAAHGGTFPGSGDESGSATHLWGPRVLLEGYARGPDRTNADIVMCRYEQRSSPMRERSAVEVTGRDGVSSVRARRGRVSPGARPGGVRSAPC